MSFAQEYQGWNSYASDWSSHRRLTLSSPPAPGAYWGCSPCSQWGVFGPVPDPCAPFRLRAKVMVVLAPPPSPALSVFSVNSVVNAPRPSVFKTRLRRIFRNYFQKNGCFLGATEL